MNGRHRCPLGQHLGQHRPGKISPCRSEDWRSTRSKPSSPVRCRRRARGRTNG